MFGYTAMESSHRDGLPVHRDVDHGVRHGDRPRPCARHEEVSPVAGHIPGQRALHPLGFPHVRTHRHRFVLRVARRTGLPQAPFHIAEAVFRTLGHSLPAAVHHDDYNFIVSAGHSPGMYAPQETSVFGR